MVEIGTYEYYIGLKKVIRQNRLTWWLRVWIYLKSNTLYFLIRHIKYINNESKRLWLVTVENFKLMLFVSNVLDPSYKAICKIVRYRNIGNWIDKYANKYEMEQNKMPLTVSEIYDILKSYPQEHGLRLLQQLPVSTLAYELLVDSFVNDNKNLFIGTIYKYNCSITKLKNFCLNCNPLSYRFLRKDKGSPIQKKQMMGFMSEFSKLQCTLHIGKDSLTEHITRIAIINPDRGNFPFLNIRHVRKELHFLLIFYFIHRKEFDPMEREIVEEIIKQPQYIYFYNKAYRCYKKYYKHEQKHFKTENTIERETNIEPLNINGNHEEFKLPDNYFELERNANDCISIDDIRDTVKEQGVRKFEAFINYVAKEGYIDNNIHIKENFAYRLTGRLKPEDPMEYIEWKADKDSKSNCLYYIVRHFYSGNGRSGKSDSKMPSSRYQRMGIFFIYHKEITNPTSHAKSANPDFIKEISGFFTEKIKEEPPKKSLR